MILTLTKSKCTNISRAMNKEFEFLIEIASTFRNVLETTYLFVEFAHGCPKNVPEKYISFVFGL